MHPILCKFGPVSVYSYGAMVALGFAAASLLIYRRAERFGLDKDKMIDMLILALVAGVAGARILYVLINLSYYVSNPLEILNLSRGGLVWYGAFLAGLPAVAVYMKRNSLEFWQVMDLAAPYLVLAQAFGRIGCFLNGCCYGVGGFPIQIVAAAALFAIFVLLRLWQDKRHFTGEIFLGYCVLYGIKRFAIEFFRGDNPKIFHGLTLSQIISLVIIAAAAIVLTRKIYLWKNRNSNSE